MLVFYDFISGSGFPRSQPGLVGELWWVEEDEGDEEERERERAAGDRESKKE